MKRIIIISGHQGSGKSTLAAGLKTKLDNQDYDAQVFKFAGILYQLHNACLPILHQAGIVHRSVVKDGALLQVLGTEYGRNHHGPDVWVKVLRRSINKWLTENPRRVAVIDDCRFPNELEAFQKDSVTVRLTCPEWVRRERCSAWREKPHESETALDRAMGWDLILDTLTNSVSDATERVLMYRGTTTWSR